ncbi:MAG: hypothetical protein A2095_10335 [Sphingomonadales bacterium GWF1_63_6]|jgi:hypothetical protein|nr:MAG: hypothetical protein A2095_10335 [Sphingomonadales bacterium GWF1_63_6]
MNEDVANWQMRGQVFVWRYSASQSSHKGWHFSAEPAACGALVELLTCMRSAAEAVHRTIKLSRPTPSISSVPGYGDPKNDDFEKLRIIFDPSFPDLQLQLTNDRLELFVGEERCDDILTALTDVQNGKGDFAFGSNQKGASPPIWFWWMPWSGQSYAR